MILFQIKLFVLLSSTTSVICFLGWTQIARSARNGVSLGLASRQNENQAPPTMLPDPMPNSIGNFFENKTDQMAFIQCYMMVNYLQYDLNN